MEVSRGSGENKKEEEEEKYSAAEMKVRDKLACYDYAKGDVVSRLRRLKLEDMRKSIANS